jgi:flagellar motor switch protein FliG
MKSVFELTGTQRAAALLIAIGPQTAAGILKHLDEESIDKLTIEMAQIDRLSPLEKEDLIGEFLIDLRKAARGIKGGENKARDILIQVFGDERAEEIIEKINVPDAKREFEFIQDIEPEILFELLKDEHPQSLAVIFAYLKAQQSGYIMKKLTREISSDVALRIARMSTVSQEAVAAMAVKLKEKYKLYLQKSEGDLSGGVDTLINIMNHMKGSEEKKLMDNLEVHIPDVSTDIRRRLFMFENIATLSNMEVRILIDEIQDDRCIATALKGAGDEVRFKILRNMSQNRATDIINELDVMGPVRLSEVEDNRSSIVDVMKRLHDRGEITLRKGDEIYVE